jgi:hypothetical protein
MQRDRDWAYPGLRRTATAPAGVVPASRTNASPYATFHLGTTAAVSIDARDPTRVAILSPACASPVPTPACQDPSLIYTNGYEQLQGKVTRGVLHGYGEYALGDDVKLFTEISYAKVTAYDFSSPAFSSTTSSTMPVTIATDNAYLLGPRNRRRPAARHPDRRRHTPRQLRRSARRSPSSGASSAAATRRSERETVRRGRGHGRQADAFGRTVNWGWYGQYGETTGTVIQLRPADQAAGAAAVDAVNVAGQVVCRDVTARAAGCVPWDLINGPSQAAVAWAYADSTVDEKVQQTVLNAHFDTDLFTLPAGPVSIAAASNTARSRAASSRTPSARPTCSSSTRSARARARTTRPRPMPKRASRCCATFPSSRS